MRSAKGGEADAGPTRRSRPGEVWGMALTLGAPVRSEISPAKSGPIKAIRMPMKTDANEIADAVFKRLSGGWRKNIMKQNAANL